MTKSMWCNCCGLLSTSFSHGCMDNVCIAACISLQDDLNQVKGKPQYKELTGKGSLVEQAEEAAAYARSWNDSLIDRMFGGQMQSTVTCKKCQKESHCFEVFMDMHVPIPKQKPVSVEVSWWWGPAGGRLHHRKPNTSNNWRALPS